MIDGIVAMADTKGYVEKLDAESRNKIDVKIHRKQHVFDQDDDRPLDEKKLFTLSDQGHSQH
jgi:hypothetical protein